VTESSVGIHIVFLLPGSLKHHDANNLPLLNRMLSRAVPLSFPSAQEPVLSRYFRLGATPWPWASITREYDRGDAQNHTWVRADPAHWQVGSTGGHLCAVGDFGLSNAEVEALYATLTPFFAEHHYEFSAPAPNRWYLRALKHATVVPHFEHPDIAVQRHWSALLETNKEEMTAQQLLNEVQMVLHQHSVNNARMQNGQKTINSLWFWGAGCFPSRRESTVTHILTRDNALISLANACGVLVSDTWPDSSSSGVYLVDLRVLKDDAKLISDWLGPAFRAWHKRELATIEFCFADGHACRLETKPWWQIW
jgi:hypothetical protein